MQRAENKKLLKNGYKNGVLVGYHLEKQEKLEQKKFKEFCKAVEFYLFEIPNQWKVLSRPLIICSQMS